MVWNFGNFSMCHLKGVCLKKKKIKKAWLGDSLGLDWMKGPCCQAHHCLLLYNCMWLWTAWMVSYAAFNICQSYLDFIHPRRLCATTCILGCDLNTISSFEAGGLCSMPSSFCFIPLAIFPISLGVTSSLRTIFFWKCRNHKGLIPGAASHLTTRWFIYSNVTDAGCE